MKMFLVSVLTMLFVAIPLQMNAQSGNLAKGIYKAVKGSNNAVRQAQANAIREASKLRPAPRPKWNAPQVKPPRVPVIRPRGISSGKKMKGPKSNGAFVPSLKGVAHLPDSALFRRGGSVDTVVLNRMKAEIAARRDSVAASQKDTLTH